MDHVNLVQRYATDYNHVIATEPILSNATFVERIMDPFWTLRSAVCERMEWETAEGERSALVFRGRR